MLGAACALSGLVAWGTYAEQAPALGRSPALAFYALPAAARPLTMPGAAALQGAPPVAPPAPVLQPAPVVAPAVMMPLRSPELSMPSAPAGAMSTPVGSSGAQEKQTLMA